jgi:hypothetical protein
VRTIPEQEQAERRKISVEDLYAEIQNIKELVMAGSSSASNRKIIKDLANAIGELNTRVTEIEEHLSGSEEETPSQSNQTPEQEQEPKF